MLKLFKLLCVLFLLMAFGACANQGAGPDGGPYDETPPKLVGMTPPTKVAGGKRLQFTLTFDELIKVEKAEEKVVVSPPQLEAPEIKISGRSITVRLLDSIQANTTYTVDFSDAITDNNEGNPLGQYTYVFSTGVQIDTMEMSGRVLQAEDLEPIKGILVGLYANTNDSAFSQRAFERVARTDGDGRFTIKGLSADKTYRVFALEDTDGNFRYSAKNERIAFSTQTFTPTSHPSTRRDTLWIDSLHYDSIRITAYTHFTPDDILLLAFKTQQQNRAFLKLQRETPAHFTTYFTAGSTHRPSIKGLNFNEQEAFVEQRSTHNDTITYWLRQTQLLQQDTLRFAYTYEAWDDTIQQHLLRTDTLEAVPRLTFAKQQKEKAKELEKWEKEREKKNKKGKLISQAPPRDYISVSTHPLSALNPLKNIQLRFSEPLQRFDTTALHLQLKVDSSYQDVPYELDTLAHPFHFLLRAEWRPGQEYQVLLDSAAAESYHGVVNAPYRNTFKILNSEDFGTVFLTLRNAPPHCVVQLLDQVGKVIETQKLKADRASFYFVSEGEYYLRCFADENQDGIWTTGEWESRRDAEKVFYSPKKIKVKANWDSNEEWDVTATKQDAQKARELIKQKESKTENNPHRMNIERAKQRGE